MLAATRNTSLYSDQPSLFACLLSWLAAQLSVSLRQSPQLDNGPDVVLLRSNGHKAAARRERLLEPLVWGTQSGAPITK